MLQSILQARQSVLSGSPLILAGSESALSQMPKGNWIAGTIPYFMDVNGGICSQSEVFVTPLPTATIGFSIREYSAADLASIFSDAPDHGVTFLIIPWGSAAHAAYAQSAPGYDGFLLKPVIGWIAGVDVTRIGRETPRVFNGKQQTRSESQAIALHFAMPADQHAEIDIVNIFRPGSGDSIVFPSSGFSAQDCKTEGKLQRFAEYVQYHKIDVRVPLVADYNGSYVNVSIQNVDANSGVVRFYAPVFAGVSYRFAAPVGNYTLAFENAIRNGGETAACFSCNCVLNYLYGNLEGKRTGSITGPITFGEIAHQLLNQTLVRLRIQNKKVTG